MSDSQEKNEPEEEKSNLSAVTSSKSPFGLFTLYTDEDALEGYLYGVELKATLTVEVLFEILAEMDISQGVKREALEEIIGLAEDKEPAVRVLVAEGMPVVAGEDAYIDFHKRPTGMRTVIEKNVRKVDYKEVNAFENVREGDHLATFVPLVEGQGGTDIYGKTIPAPQVRDLDVGVGEGVRYDEEGRRYYATRYGHVVYEKNTLVVDPLYHVQGDVDLSQGNIRFIGEVIIDKDVLDEFEVSAEQGITIGGTAEACALSSGTSITIQGGVTGKGKGRIEAKDGLKSRFLNEVEVICGGDVIIENEIVNCKVYALGRVVVDKGTIVGGEVVALKGILAQDVGSDLGVKTTLVAGLDYKVHEKILGVNKDLVQLIKRQQRFLNQTAPLLQKALSARLVDKRLHEIIHDNMRTIRGLRRQGKRLEMQSEEMAKSFASQAVKCVSVTRMLYPSVNIVVGKYECDTKKALTGSLSIYENSRGQCAQIIGGILVEKAWEDETAIEQLQAETAVDPDETRVGDESDERVAAGEKNWTYEEVSKLFKEFAPSAVDGEGKVVVVAEDSAPMRAVICAALKKKGFVVHEAQNGLTALKLVRSHVPDCCLFDINMPQLTGFDILEAMKKDDRYSSIPVVLCTARKQKRDIVLAQRLGAAGYFIKPFKMEDILMKVASLCGD